MEPADILDSLETELAEMSAKGQRVVAVDALQKYIEKRRKHARSSVEDRTLEQQRSLAHLDMQTKHALEMFKSVIDAGREALNALVLINGGAVVALLGFMGATISKGLPATLGMQLTWSVLLFGCGVLTGAIGFGFRYCAQAFFKRYRMKAGFVFNLCSVLSAAIGYCLFGSGMYAAYSGFVLQFAL